MKKQISTLRRLIRPPDGPERMKCYDYKIYSYEDEFHLMIRRLPFGKWKPPTTILNEFGISNSITQRDDFIRNKTSYLKNAEKSLADFAQKISEYKSPRKKKLDKGSLFEYKVINEL